MEQWKTSRFNYFLPLQCFFPMLNPPLVSFLSKKHNFQVLKKGFLLLISPKFLVVFSQYAKIFHLELLNLKLTIFVKYHASTLCHGILRLANKKEWFFVLLFSSNSYGKQCGKQNEHLFSIFKQENGGSKAGVPFETPKGSRWGVPLLETPILLREN